MNAANTPMTLDDLTAMSQAELDDLYRGTDSPGEVPVGTTEGSVLVLPGRRVATPLRMLARLICWQGKIFAPETSDLKNRISPFRIPAIRARVYPGESWLDGGESTILDYSETSFAAQWIRDEIREVAPGLWLGRAYVRKWHALDFTLSA